MRDRALGGQEVTVGRMELAAMIKAAQARNPQQPVLIAADKSVRYEAVLNVMDELQRQQVAKIGLLVQPGRKLTIIWSPSAGRRASAFRLHSQSRSTSGWRSS